MKKIRKWFRILHRDLGYFFAALTIIYSLSGIAVNHLRDWNPNYVVTSVEFESDLPAKASKAQVIELLDRFGVADQYKKHYTRRGSELKVFLKNGTVVLDTETNSGVYDNIENRLFFREANYLHLNPVRAWTWFSDFFAVSLIFLAISGLVIVKGKKGFKWRGAILFAAGLAVPIVFLLLYFY